MATAPRKSLAERQAESQHVFDVDPTPAPVVETVKPDPTPAPAPVEKPVLAATTRIGITIAPEDLDLARQAFMSDLDRLEDAPQSLARWMIRAISRHLDREPVARWAAAKAAPGTGSTTRKTPYNATVPVGMPQALAAAVKEERAAGRSTNASALIREALAIEVHAATNRAGGVLPRVVGPLPHAR